MEMKSCVMSKKCQIVFCTLALKGVGVVPPTSIAVIDMQIVAVLLDVINNRINDDVATYGNKVHPTIARRRIVVGVAGVKYEVSVAGPNGVDRTSIASGIASHGQRVVIDIGVRETRECRLRDIDTDNIVALCYRDDCRTI